MSCTAKLLKPTPCFPGKECGELANVAEARLLTAEPNATTARYRAVCKLSNTFNQMRVPICYP